MTGTELRQSRINTLVFGCIALAVAAWILMGMTGCELTTRSPFSGRPVTAAQLAAEADDAEEANEKAMRDELARAEREAREAKTAFELAASRIEGDARQGLLELQATYEDFAAELTSRVDKIGAEREERRRNVERRYEAAYADIESKAARLEGILSFAQSAGVGSLPGGGIALGLGGLLVGGMVSGVRAKKREDKAWDEAQAASSAAQAKVDAAWDEATVRAQASAASAPIAELVKALAQRA